MYSEPVNLSITFENCASSKILACKLHRQARHFKTAQGLVIHLSKVHYVELNKSERKWIYKTARSLERAKN